MRFAGYVKFAGLIVAVAIGVTASAPQYRSTVTRVTLFALIAVVAVALVDVAQRRSPASAASAFEPRRTKTVLPDLPADLERLAVEIRAFDAAVEHGAPVPGHLRRTCRTLVAARLAQRHGLRMEDPADQAACAAACGDELWAMLDGQPFTIDGHGLAQALERL